jgi:hypothetical protein
LFVTVTVSGALGDSIVVLGNFNDFGAGVRVPNTPVPANLTGSEGFVLLLLFTVTDPVLFAAANGVKVTIIVHLAAGARV